MEAIPDDIWSLVAELTYNNGDMKSLQAMCLVSSGFSRVAVPWLYRSIIFDMKVQEITNLVTTILDKDRGRYIHAISINEWAAASYEHLITEISVLLPALSALQYFSWRFADHYGGLRPLNLANPQRLMMMFDGMTSLSKLELGYVIGWGSEQQLNSPSCKKVAFLARLDLHMGCATVEPEEEQLEQCKALIGAATNLRTLRLSMNTSRHTSCPPALYFKENEHIPPITTLILDEFSYSLGRANRQELEHRLQLSALRTLLIRTGGYEDLDRFLRTLMDRGSIRLKAFEISITHQGFHNYPGLLPILSKFLLHFKGLEKLRCGGHTAPTFNSIQAAISNHSETLLALSLVEQHYWSPRENCQGTSLKDLALVSAICPRLQALEIELVSAGTVDLLGTNWPRDWDLPSLKTLKIYTSVDYADYDLSQFDHVQTLAIRLGNDCTRLKRLIVVVGDCKCVGGRCIWDVRYANVNGENTLTIIEESSHKTSSKRRRSFGLRTWEL